MLYVDMKKLNKIVKKAGTPYCYITDRGIRNEAPNSIKGLPVETPNVKLMPPYVSEVVILRLENNKKKVALVELYQDNIRVFGLFSPVTLKQKYHKRGLQILFDNAVCNLSNSWNFTCILQNPTIAELIATRTAHLLLQSNVPNKLCKKQGPEVDGLSTYIPDYISIFKKE